MAMTREQVSAIVLGAVRQLGEELDADALREPDEQTRLMGEKADVDSIALVSLIAEIEARISEEAGIDVVLADESAMSQLRSPFRRCGVLIDYILEKANDDG